MVWVVWLSTHRRVDVLLSARSDDAIGVAASFVLVPPWHHHAVMLPLSTTRTHGAPQSTQTPRSLVPARMQRRGSSSGKVAKWSSGRPCVGICQTLRRLRAGAVAPNFLWHSAIFSGVSFRRTGSELVTMPGACGMVCNGTRTASAS